MLPGATLAQRSTQALIHCQIVRARCDLDYANEEQRRLRERRIAQGNRTGTRNWVPVLSAQCCTLYLLQWVKTEVKLLPVLLQGDTTFPPYGPHEPFDMDEGVGEVFLGQIFRMYSRSPRGRRWRAEREGSRGEKERTVSISSSPMDKHLGGQSSKHSNTISKLMGSQVTFSSIDSQRTQ